MVAAIVLVLLPIYVGWMFGALRLSDVTVVPFDAAAWRLADPIENHRTVRSQMVDDLLPRRLLDGMDRTQVEQLLGAPLANLSNAGVDRSRWHMAYYVGMERQGFMSLDDEMLVIRFDEQGCVAEAALAVN